MNQIQFQRTGYLAWSFSVPGAVLASINIATPVQVLDTLVVTVLGHLDSETFRSALRSAGDNPATHTVCAEVQELATTLAILCKVRQSRALLTAARGTKIDWAARAEQLVLSAHPYSVLGAVIAELEQRRMWGDINEMVRACLHENNKFSMGGGLARLSVPKPDPTASQVRLPMGGR